MRATELLKRDHDEVKRLFQAFEGTKGGERRQVFEQAASALILHSDVERALLYPALEAFDETRGLVEEALTDHRVVEGLIAKLRTLDVDDPAFVDAFTELRTSAVDHAAEEEQQLFPMAGRLLGDARLRRIGQRIESEKRRREPEARDPVRRPA